MASYSSVSVDNSVDTASAPRVWSAAAKAAAVAGFALVVVSAVQPSADVHTQAYVAPTATRPIAVGAAVATPARPTLSAPHQPLLPAQAAGAAPQLAPEAPVNPVRAVGLASLWAGAMIGLGVALWNRMSALNREALTGDDEGAWTLDSRQGLAAVCGAALALNLQTAAPAMAEVRLPPLDTDPRRCERALVGNTIGQANGVSDKPLDLRMCNFEGQSLEAKTLSGALMSDGKFAGANFTEAVLSKVYAVGSDFSGANFTSAVLDRGLFDKADMSGANFYNAVITGATFTGTNLTGASFEDALIGSQDAQRLCANPTLTGESRAEVGCRD